MSIYEEVNKSVIDVQKRFNSMNSLKWDDGWFVRASAKANGDLYSIKVVDEDLLIDEGKVMEPEIIFGEMFKDTASKKIRKAVYETVDHINSFHPVKITKVIVYFDKRGHYVTEMWAGAHYSKQYVKVDDGVDAEKGVLYAHLRVSEKSMVKTKRDAVESTSVWMVGKHAWEASKLDSINAKSTVAEKAEALLLELMRPEYRSYVVSFGGQCKKASEHIRNNYIGSL